MIKDLHFSIDKYDLQKISDTELMKIRMWIVSEGENRHEKPITWQAIEMARPTLIGKPIVAKYDRFRSDFKGHELDEVPIGVVLSDDEIYFETDESGKKWLVADGYLWYRYAKNATSVLERDKIKNLSMEILVTESGESDSIESFVFTGITLISATPAIPNARAEVIKFSDVETEIKHVLQAQAEEKKFGIDLTIPDEVKQNVRNAIELESRSSKSGSAVAMSFAKYLISNEKITTQKIKELSKFFSKHGNNGSTTSSAYISYLLRGGDEGLQWSEKINKILEKEEYANMEKENEKFEQSADEKDKVATDENKENMESENKEDMECKEKMSLDQNAETGANLADDKKETEDQREKTDENAEKMEDNKDDAKDEDSKTADDEKKEEDGEAEFDYKTNYETLKSEFEVLKAEADELRQFKADIEIKQRKERMEYVMNEVSETDMPKEDLEAWTAKFSEFESIDAWENAVKADAFKYAKKESKKDGVVKYGLPNTDVKDKPKGVWARI